MDARKDTVTLFASVASPLKLLAMISRVPSGNHSSQIFSATRAESDICTYNGSHSSPHPDRSFPTERALAPTEPIHHPKNIQAAPSETPCAFTLDRIVSPTLPSQARCEQQHGESLSKHFINTCTSRWHDREHTFYKSVKKTDTTLICPFLRNRFNEFDSSLRKRRHHQRLTRPERKRGWSYSRATCTPCVSTLRWSTRQWPDASWAVANLVQVVRGVAVVQHANAWAGTRYGGRYPCSRSKSMSSADGFMSGAR